MMMMSLPVVSITMMLVLMSMMAAVEADFEREGGNRDHGQENERASVQPAILFHLEIHRFRNHLNVQLNLDCSECNDYTPKRDIISRPLSIAIIPGFW